MTGVAKRSCESPLRCYMMLPGFEQKDDVDLRLGDWSGMTEWEDGGTGVGEDEGRV